MSTPLYLSGLAGTQRSQFRINPASTVGPPTTGYHLIGEIHTDSLGSLWHCIATGTPGTWEQIGQEARGQLASMSIGAHTIEALDITLFRTTRWALELSKSTNIQVLEIVATHNGITAVDVRPTSLQQGYGPFDITATVSVIGGLLSLVVTPASTGWTATWQRLYSLPVESTPSTLLIFSSPIEIFGLPIDIF